MSESQTPLQFCEQFLLADKTYNIEHCIWHSENEISDRLLARGTELRDAYEEIHRKLHAYPHAVETMLGLVLSSAAHWDPTKLQEARMHRADLERTNKEIERKACELADLLDHRASLQNTSGFSCDTHYHVCNAIESASMGNYLFQSYVKEKLDAMCGQFDLKYWPSLAEVVREIGNDAGEAKISATDPLTAAGTAGVRSSKADFIKAMFAGIDENREAVGGLLPTDFKLTDRSLASLMNCALNLEPEELIDDAYIKRLRQRERNGEKV